MFLTVNLGRNNRQLWGCLRTFAKFNRFPPHSRAIIEVGTWA